MYERGVCGWVIYMCVALQSFFTEPISYFALHNTILAHSIKTTRSKVFNYCAERPRCFEMPRAACCFTHCSNTDKVLLKFDGSGSASRSENS